jgi:hypothetical protein
MGPDQPGTPVDPSKALQGPYGTVSSGWHSSEVLCFTRPQIFHFFPVSMCGIKGMSGPIFGLCPGSRDWIKERENPMTGKDWIKVIG